MTGIGKMVNSLRKRDGDVGRRSKELVRQWKQLLPSTTEEASTSVTPSHTHTVALPTPPTAPPPPPYLPSSVEDERVLSSDAVQRKRKGRHCFLYSSRYFFLLFLQHQFQWLIIVIL